MTTDGALTRLIRERGGARTLRELRDRAIDPQTGYQPSVETIGKLRRGQTVKPNPELIRAVAAALELPPERVQLAAAEQYLGYVASPAGTGTAVHAPGARTDRARRAAERWEKEEEQYNPREGA